MNTVKSTLAWTILIVYAALLIIPSMTQDGFFIHVVPLSLLRIVLIVWATWELFLKPETEGGEIK